MDGRREFEYLTTIYTSHSEKEAKDFYALVYIGTSNYQLNLASRAKIIQSLTHI